MKGTSLTDVWKDARYQREANASRDPEDRRVCPACEGTGAIRIGHPADGLYACHLCHETGWATDARYYGFLINEAANQLDEDRYQLDYLLDDPDGDATPEQIDRQKDYFRQARELLTKRLGDAAFANVEPDDFIVERGA